MVHQDKTISLSSWRRQIIVIGKELISKFEDNKNILKII